MLPDKPKVGMQLFSNLLIPLSEYEQILTAWSVCATMRIIDHVVYFIL